MNQRDKMDKIRQKIKQGRKVEKNQTKWGKKGENDKKKGKKYKMKKKKLSFPRFFHYKFYSFLAQKFKSVVFLKKFNSKRLQKIMFFNT